MVGEYSATDSLTPWTPVGLHLPSWIPHTSGACELSLASADTKRMTYGFWIFQFCKVMVTFSTTDANRKNGVWLICTPHMTPGIKITKQIPTQLRMLKRHYLKSWASLLITEKQPTVLAYLWAIPVAVQGDKWGTHIHMLCPDCRWFL